MLVIYSALEVSIGRGKSQLAVYDVKGCRLKLLNWKWLNIHSSFSRPMMISKFSYYLYTRRDKPVKCYTFNLVPYIMIVYMSVGS